MAFAAQVRLSDVPFLVASEELLSFHYCEACAHEGRMSHGMNDPAQGYALDIFDALTAPPDGRGMVTPCSMPPYGVTFSEVTEVPSLEDWALSIEPPPFDGISDFDENVGEGLVHVSRSKLGGWPSWPQSPEWPECSEGRRMLLALQIDSELGRDCTWAGGGYAFVFVCPNECRRREAELVIQTT